MIWEFWIERHRTSGRQRSGESFTPTEPAEGRREHEARNFGELWKWRRCGNVGIQKQDSQRSHSVLEISRKQRDSHISTAPTAPYCVSTEQPRLKELGAWKSGNPNS